MNRPLQPAFKIRVFCGKQPIDLTGTGLSQNSSEGYVDVERCVAPGVVYEESADLLTHLNFTIDKFAEVLLYYFYIGQAIILYGGHYADDESGMSHVFSGTVTRIKTRFTNSGRVSFTVECMHYGFTKMGKDYKNYVYPDPTSPRKFAQKDTMSVKDIIEGIARENNFEIGKIDLSTDAKKVNYDKVSIRYQRDQTDWQFLTSLAQDLGCSVWISTENGTSKLNFVSHEKAFREQSSDISFLYPLNGKIKNVNTSTEMIRASEAGYDRPRIIRDVTVDEDISLAYATSRSATYFDKNTGEYCEAIAKIETDSKGNTSTVFYELDEQRIQQVHNENPKLADEIRSNGPSSLPWGNPDNPDPKTASYYYKAIRRYEEHQAVFDRAFFGITISAKCNMDLNIHSQRTYKIRGILSYHSKDLDSSFFLRGLKHIWDADGCWTELDFIR